MAAISSGSCQRLSGTSFLILSAVHFSDDWRWATGCRWFQASQTERLSGVLTMPGQSELTRTP